VSHSIQSEEKEIAKVLKEVEKRANHNNVKTTNMKAKPVKDKGFYKKILISAECEADVESLTKFIYDLEKSSQRLRIHTLRINTKGRYATSLEVSMIITKILVS
jgi:Tfp pilus assembly protein PilO